MKKNDLFYSYDGKYEEIDKQTENKLVAEYQSTKDNKILEKVFLDRVPTLINWVKKEYYPGLDISEEDFFVELTRVFLKTVDHYDINRGHFNTCLWNFMLNRIKNIKNSTHAKKRRPEGLEGSLINAMISLDYVKEESDNALHSMLSDGSIDFRENIKLDELLKELSHGDTEIYSALFEIAHGESISSVVKRDKFKKVTLPNFNSPIPKKNLIQELKRKFKYEFKLLSYRYNHKEKCYDCFLEFKKTEISEKISKKIRFLKANKTEYIEKII